MIDGIKLRQEVAENTAKSLLAVDQAQIDSIVDAIIKKVLYHLHYKQ